jgi:hypothetical protein
MRERGVLPGSGLASRRGILNPLAAPAALATRMPITIMPSPEDAAEWEMDQY